MRKRQIVIFTLVAVLISPTQANGFFNNDCKNLKKRTTTNQIKYEKAWNTYQNVLAKWINSKPDGSELWATSQPVMNRFQQVGKLQLVIIEDFTKYPKCVKQPKGSLWGAERNGLLSLLKNVDAFSLYYANNFSSINDYLAYIK